MRAFCKSTARAALAGATLFFVSGCSVNWEAYRYHCTSADASTGSVVIDVDRTMNDGTSQMELGAVHADPGLDGPGDPTAIQNARSLLSSAVRLQRVSIMGDGVDNPEPSRGTYNWSTLDRRMQLVRDTGGTPVIVLCAAPDWMKGGTEGTTNWAQVDAFPLPEHYQDFAALSVEVARRYPDVHHFVIWNGMRGLWNPSANNWDFATYTAMYNVVYDALKAANPALQIGGPDIYLESTGSNGVGGPVQYFSELPIIARNLAVIDHWFANKHGADFLAVERLARDFQDTYTYTESEMLGFTPVIDAIMQQLRMHAPNLPVYFTHGEFIGSDNWDFQAAGLASLMLHAMRGGSAAWFGMPYGGSAMSEFRGNDQSLFTSPQTADGGQALPNYGVYRRFHEFFPPGTQLVRATSSSADVEVIASSEHTLLVNKRSSMLTALVNGIPVTLAPYQVTDIPTPDSRCR